MKLDLVIEVAATAKAAAAIVRMPGLETLLARGEPATLSAGTLEQWLIEAFGYDSNATTANAAFFALGEGLAAGTEYWLHADPVCLLPTRTHLTLHELPVDSLTHAEAQALSAALIAHFASNDCVLFTPHPQRWYLRLKEAPDLQTLSPAHCAGTLQESDLPTGRDSAQWKRMITEVQMLLHSHPVNVARESAGQSPVNAIWPWGGGYVPVSASRARYDSVWSDDLLVHGLACATGVTAQALPRDAQAVLTHAAADTDVLVVFREPGRGRGSDFAAVEPAWTTTLLNALKSGQLGELTIMLWRPPIARRITRAHLRRWWRRRRALQAYG